jgi:DNA invertase Pin-like site-specific DNA recombinase
MGFETGEQMRAAIYARVSKDDGSQTTENQLPELRRLAESQNWHVYKEFVDHESGAKGDREQFQAMLKDASRRKFDVLLVWASDRLTREGAYETMHYVKVLDSYGVRFRSYTEPFLDTTGPVRDLLIAIAGWLAQQEREKIRLRTLAGQARARAQGKIIGRPKVAVDVFKLAALRSRGLSWSQITKVTGISKGTAQRALTGLPKSTFQNGDVSPVAPAAEIRPHACP